jgi:hypothetical protein
MSELLSDAEWTSFTDWCNSTAPAGLLDQALSERPADVLTALLRVTPSAVLTESGLAPDPWQESVLNSSAARTLLLCSRQAGKSTTAAAMGLATALTEPDSLVLLLSPTLRQSGELFRAKLLPLYDAIGESVAAKNRTALSLELANGSRVVSLPENEEGVRGYSGVRLIVIDEASRVGDNLYYAVRPMLAVSRGRLVALSTPFGKRGWFFDAWESGDGWRRVKVAARDCPRIGEEFLADERRALGERWFAQEYLCSFEDAVGAVFMQSDIDAAIRDIPPLFG